MNHREIIGVMATDPHGVIGKGGGLPWHYADELCATSTKEDYMKP